MGLCGFGIMWWDKCDGPVLSCFGFMGGYFEVLFLSLLFYFNFYGLGLMGFATLVSHSREI